MNSPREAQVSLPHEPEGFPIFQRKLFESHRGILACLCEDLHLDYKPLSDFLRGRIGVNEKISQSLAVIADHFDMSVDVLFPMDQCRITFSTLAETPGYIFLEQRFGLKLRNKGDRNLRTLFTDHGFSRQDYDRFLNLLLKNCSRSGAQDFINDIATAFGVAVEDLFPAYLYDSSLYVPRKDLASVSLISETPEAVDVLKHSNAPEVVTIERQQLLQELVESVLKMMTEGQAQVFETLFLLPEGNLSVKRAAERLGKTQHNVYQLLRNGRNNVLQHEPDFRGRWEELLQDTGDSHSDRVFGF